MLNVRSKRNIWPPSEWNTRRYCQIGADKTNWTTGKVALDQVLQFYTWDCFSYSVDTKNYLEANLERLQ